MLAAGLLATTATTPGVAVAATGVGPDRTGGGSSPGDRVLLHWADGVDAAGRAGILAEHVPELDTPPVAVTATVDAVTVGASHAAQVAGRLDGLEQVVAAEVDRFVLGSELDTREAAAPDDPLFAQQWGLRNVGQDVLRPSATVRARAGVDARVLEGWSLTRGDPSVVVAVIDTAIDRDHPDLLDAVVDQRGTSPSIALTPGFHGTAVASVIGARADDGIGLTGVAPDVSLLGIAAFQAAGDEPGRSTLTDVLTAFDLAMTAGADVINASWVTPQDSALLRAAVAEAGVPVVAASGNEGRELGPESTMFPASYDLPNLVTVTAVGPTGGIPAFANVGASVIDVAAPGDAILVAVPGGGHAFASGTSFAAPHVSGAIALARSVAPYATPRDLVDAVSWTSRPELSLALGARTGGMLDVGALLHGVQQPVCRRDRLAAASFEDVARTNAHVTGIDCIVAAGVTSGRRPGFYDPATNVTREQMASFLVGIIERTTELPEAPPSGFVDVDPDGIHAAAIDQLVRLGIIRGNGGGRFHPGDVVTRGQFATFLVGMHAELTGEPTVPSRRWFSDTADHIHADSVDRARDLGLVRGVDKVHFAPGEATRRDQMASVLARALDALARGGVDAR